tara:strand:- start:12720 stop:13142 length:423 start_codon:yes stop_codon:yes gene_type:complete
MKESARDRRAQRLAVERIESQFGWDLEELHMRYFADWVAMKDGKPDAIVEYKRRYFPSSTHDSVFLDEHKYTQCRLHAESLGVRFAYIMEWDDVFGVVHPTPAHIIGSRISIETSDRRDDTNDSYLHIHLPLSLFELFGK